MSITSHETTAAPAPVRESEVDAVASALDALIGRLTYDEAFGQALANAPHETLEAAGVHLPKEALEAYIRTRPERFERASEALFQRVDSDFLMALSAPSCDSPI